MSTNIFRILSKFVAQKQAIVGKIVVYFHFRKTFTKDYFYEFQLRKYYIYFFKKAPTQIVAYFQQGIIFKL